MIFTSYLLTYVEENSVTKEERILGFTLQNTLYTGFFFCHVQGRDHNTLEDYQGERMTIVDIYDVFYSVDVKRVSPIIWFYLSDTLPQFYTSSLFLPLPSSPKQKGNHYELLLGVDVSSWYNSRFRGCWVPKKHRCPLFLSLTLPHPNTDLPSLVLFIGN